MKNPTSTAPLRRDESSSDSERLGSEIRKLRKARAASLEDLAVAIGRSSSFVSQVERGRAAASIADLKGIAQHLGVPLGWFFTSDNAPGNERGKIVRSNTRRKLGAVTTGLVEELLSPDIGGAFETFLSTFEPHSELKLFNKRNTEEEGYVIRGTLDLWIGKKKFVLNAGDSFRIVREPFRWANTSEADAVVVWIIAPPTY
jgi:transcriptional regulator with XRE-family HTH domain